MCPVPVNSRIILSDSPAVPGTCTKSFHDNGVLYSSVTTQDHGAKVNALSKHNEPEEVSKIFGFELKHKHLVIDYN